MYMKKKEFDEAVKNGFGSEFNYSYSNYLTKNFSSCDVDRFNLEHSNFIKRNDYKYESNKFNNRINDRFNYNYFINNDYPHYSMESHFKKEYYLPFWDEKKIPTIKNKNNVINRVNQHITFLKNNDVKIYYDAQGKVTKKIFDK